LVVGEEKLLDGYRARSVLGNSGGNRLAHLEQSLVVGEGFVGFGRRGPDPAAAAAPVAVDDG
jgi:hypothetical protein